VFITQYIHTSRYPGIYCSRKYRYVARYGIIDVDLTSKINKYTKEKKIKQLELII